MRSFWSDPYLWIHVAGVAALPIALELCLIGFAVGDPFLPLWLELFLVAAVGIAPILWMQWQKPFYIFSLLVIALQPEQLSIDQRKLLQFFKTPEVRVLTALAPLLLLCILWQLYQVAPLVLEAAAFIPQWRGVGLLLAAIAFLVSNLFLQVPISVLRVMLASEASFAAVEPFPLERVAQEFTVLGLRVKQIVPPLTDAQKPDGQKTTASATPPSTAEAIDVNISSPGTESLSGGLASAETVSSGSTPEASPVDSEANPAPEPVSPTSEPENPENVNGSG